MAIKAPGWCHTAVPTIRGWEDPNTGELFKSCAHTQAQIDEFNGVSKNAAKPKKTVKAMEDAQMEDTVQQLNEAPANGKSLEEMNKLELEAFGRQHGIELDRREKKSSLLGQVKNLFS